MRLFLSSRGSDMSRRRNALQNDNRCVSLENHYQLAGKTLSSSGYLLPGKRLSSGICIPNAGEGAQRGPLFTLGPPHAHRVKHKTLVYVGPNSRLAPHGTALGNKARATCLSVAEASSTLLHF